MLLNLTHPVTGTLEIEALILWVLNHFDWLFLFFEFIQHDFKTVAHALEVLSLRALHLLPLIGFSYPFLNHVISCVL